MTDLQKAYNAFLEGRIRKEKNGSIEKERKDTEVSQLEITILKRMLAQNRNKDGLLHVNGIVIQVYFLPRPL
jgi:hypothetical protein